MHRFQVLPGDVGSDSLVIRGQDALHLSKVLRLGPGDEIIAFDGSGLEYRARVERIDRGETECSILARYRSQKEPPLDVYLLQGLPKADKMELIVQKTTELGIRGILPVRTSRAVMQLEGNKARDRVERWQKIAAEAAKQCGRPKVPTVYQVLDLPSALASLPAETLVLAAYEAEEGVGLSQALSGWISGPVALVIGPEGGFNEKEIEALRLAGAIAVSLGPRILRTETAGLAALTMVLYQLGDLGKAP